MMDRVVKVFLLIAALIAFAASLACFDDMSRARSNLCVAAGIVACVLSLAVRVPQWDTPTNPYLFAINLVLPPFALLLSLCAFAAPMVWAIAVPVIGVAAVFLQARLTFYTAPDWMKPAAPLRSYRIGELEQIEQAEKDGERKKTIDMLHSGWPHVAKPPAVQIKLPVIIVTALLNQEVAAPK